MNGPKQKTIRQFAGLVIAIALTFPHFVNAAEQVSVFLGSAANLAVLAGYTVTSAGLATIGDLALSPGSDVTVFPPGTVNGAMHVTDSAAAQAQADLTTAFYDAAGRILAPVIAAGNLGELTLTPGLYKFTSGLEITSGDITRDAEGDANAIFIFQMASITLVTTEGRRVVQSIPTPTIGLDVLIDAPSSNAPTRFYRTFYP